MPATPQVPALAGMTPLGIDPLRAGVRVATHPATDAWMRGDRYGESLGRLSRGPRKGFVRVRLDSGRVRAFHPSNVSAAD